MISNALLFIVVLAMLVGCLTPLSTNHSPIVMMGQGLNLIKKGGAVTISDLSAEFIEGGIYAADAAASEAVGLANGSVSFCCQFTQEEKCSGFEFPEDTFDCQPSTLTAKKTIQGRIMAYCRKTKEDCFIGFKSVEGV
ncbi:hypothetical protein ACFLQ2_02790 [archaeon]